MAPCWAIQNISFIFYFVIRIVSDFQPRWAPKILNSHYRVKIVTHLKFSKAKIWLK